MNDRDALLSLADYGDEATYRAAGQGGFLQSQNAFEA